LIGRWPVRSEAFHSVPFCSFQTHKSEQRNSEKMIPVSQPFISELGVNLVADPVRSICVFSIGPYLDRFEQLFADFFGVKQALLGCNGTAGLHLALTALPIGNGDEVIVPHLTSSANAVAAAGAVSMFTDVC
jgi:perosamine synthetase